MEIGSISFEWKEELVNPLFKTYRVVCTIKTKENVTVTGSTTAKIESVKLSRDIVEVLELERPEWAEDRALKQADEMLFYATGERCYERKRRPRED